MAAHQTNQADLNLVADVINGAGKGLRRLSKRLVCVSQILAALNVRRGHPFDSHDLADLEQDVMVLIWKKLKTFEGRASLEVWIFRLCSLEMMNHLRRKARKLPSLLPSLEGGDQASAAPSSFDPSQRNVHEGLEALGGVSAQVIRMKNFDDMTFQRISEVLDISPNTAKTHYYRGLKMLKDYIEGREEEG